MTRKLEENMVHNLLVTLHLGLPCDFLVQKLGQKLLVGHTFKCAMTQTLMQHDVARLLGHALFCPASSWSWQVWDSMQTVKWVVKVRTEGIDSILQEGIMA